MVKQILNKIIIILIVLTLTSGNLMLIGTEAYAAFESLEEQKKESSDKNVSFDSYFVVDEKQIHSVNLNAQNEAYINFEIEIQNGYLKESVIDLNNANFEIISIEQQNIEGIVKNTTTNKIELNQISGNKAIITAKIKMKHNNYVEANYSSKETTIIFTSNYTNIKGVTKQINAEKYVAINWVANISSSIDTNVSKYMQADNKTIIETTVNSSLNENVLPIKNTNIKVEVPRISEQLPEEVRVHANSTIGTNGIQNGESFNTSNWNYNSETGELTINVENQANQEGKISWNKGTDEYIVTYIFNTAELINKIELNATNTITTYSENVVENNIRKTQEISLNGNYVDYEITATENLNKGFIYANSIYETPYSETLIANISYKNVLNELLFTKDVEAYNLEDGRKILADAYYKNTKISKSNFNKILGEEGKINIYNGENLIATIDNNTQTDENGNLIYNYESNYNNIRIETTQPIEEGKLVIENNKAISATSSYNYKIQKLIRNIETTLIGVSSNQEEQIKTATTNLEETTTKANIEIGKQNLSTVITNENVELRAVLEADDITDDLYKNPTIRIELPEEVESVNIKSVNVLFNDQMEVSTINIESGRIINLQLTGEQTQYITNNNKGITIIINTDITLFKTASSKQTQVTMQYTNEKAINLENQGIVSTEVNISAPVGVIALNSVTNTSTGEKATSLGSNKEEVSLQRNSAITTATYTQTIINNENEPVNGMKILGRIGTEGDNLGSTINAKLISTIGNTENIDYTVYYSENAEATEDLQNSENAWTQEANQNVKSYLIVVNNEISQGEELNFGYNIEIPENLGYGANLASTYSVEYNTQKETLNKEATQVLLSTGSGPVLESILEDNTVDGTIYTEQIVEYTITITNNGTADAENVKINVPVPEGMVYVVEEINSEDGNIDIIEKEDKTIQKEIENIKVNETKKVEVMLKAKEEKEKVEVYAQIVSEYENNETNKKAYKIANSNLDVSFVQSSGQLKIGEDLQYLVKISNKSAEKQKNVEVTVELPENMELKSVNITDIRDEEILNTKSDYKNNTVNIEIPEIEYEANINLHVVANDEIKNKIIYASVSSKEVKNQLTNKQIINILKPTGEIKISSDTQEGYVKIGDIINYNIEIKNTSPDSVFEVVAINLPSNFIGIDYKINGEELGKSSYFEDNSTNTIRIYKSIETEETILISIKVQINTEWNLKEDKTEEVTIQTKEISYEKTFNYIVEKNVVEDDEDEDDDNDNNNNGGNSDSTQNPDGTTVEPSEKEKYKISGTAWLDENKNGSLEEEETKISGIIVKAVDSSGKEKASTTTSEKGTYTLEGLTKGNYTIIFEYNSSKYYLTTYQKEGVEESKNSNVIKGTYNNKTIATTNTIQITNKSIANINIGLIQGSNFDLSLSKKVTQIAMANTKKTQTKQYDTQLAKIDLDYKYINNTKVAIEYEITVTNEGDIPGYASKIVDYLPEDFDFSTELNKDWYTSNNNIETRALVNTLINPGESQTVTLVLTKSMNENGNGIYCNTAEIAEDYNEYGEEDSDSTPGNNKEGEDDQSSANVILGLKTGGPVTYITLTLTIMTLICISAYEINKRVLKF